MTRIAARLRALPLVVSAVLSTGVARAQPQPAAAPPERVRLQGIEITQGVQNAENDVPLIGGRAAWVRVFLTARETSLRASGTLEVVDPATGMSDTIPAVEPARIPRATDATLSALRLEPGLLFRLPPNLVRGTTLRVRLLGVHQPASRRPVSCDGCGSLSEKIDVTAGDTLRLRTIGYRYRLPWPPRSFEPTTVDSANLRSWIERAYPISGLEFSYRAVDIDPATARDCVKVNQVLSVLRAEEVGKDRVHPMTHYYAMVSHGGFFMRGCPAGGMWPDHKSVAAGPTGPHAGGRKAPKNSAWDHDGSWGDWYGGHELGHTLGRAHVKHPLHDDPEDVYDGSYPFDGAALGDPRKPRGDFVGFDAGDGSPRNKRTVLPGTRWHDVMSYGPRLWVSAHNRAAIASRLREENASAIAPAPVASVHGEPWAVDSSVTVVVGAVNLTDGTGSISHLTRAERVTKDAVPAAGRVALRVIGADKRVLGTHRVPVREFRDLPPGRGRLGLISTTIPYDSTTSRIELLVNGSVVDAAVVSPAGIRLAAVRARALDLAGIEGRRPLGALQVTLGEASSGPITYFVELSPDGIDWTVTALGALRGELVLTGDRMGLPDSGVVRVTVTDGVRTATHSIDLREP